MKNNENNNCKFPTLRFPEFTEGWKEVKLKDICTLTKGAGISKNQLSADGIPCILYGELYTKYKSEVIRDIFSRTNICDSNLVRSKANDVIIPSSGESAIDIATARCIPYDGILLGGDLNIIRLIEHNGSFFSYQLNGTRKREISKVAQGVSVVHLYGEGLKNLTVFYPSNAEQDKIAMFLSLIDERIAAQNKIIEEYKRLKNALAERLLSGRIRSFRYTSNWSCTTFSKVCNIKTGDKNTQDKANNGKYPFYVRSRNIERIDSYTFDGEAVLTAGDGDIGKVFHYVNGKVGVHQRVYILNNFNCLGKFAYHYFSTFFYRRVKRMSAKNTVDSVRMEMISQMSIMLPDINEQLTISQSLDSIDEKIDIDVEILSNYLKQKAFLLSQMFI